MSVEDKVQNETTTATKCANSGCFLQYSMQQQEIGTLIDIIILMHDRCTCATTTTTTVKINSRIK